MTVLARTFRAARIATFAIAALTVPAQAFDISKMSETDRDAFGEAVRAYLLENPEVIVEAINVLEDRQAEAEAFADIQMISANAEELFDDGYSYVGGNPDGDITIVEFMDYRCGYCRRAVPEVAALLANDDNIRLVIEEFPILGDASVMSSRFAVSTRIVAGMEAYKQVHDALLDFTGEPSEVTLQRLADGLGLDGAAIIAGMEAPKVTEELQRNRALGQRLQISGTPSFVIDHQLLRGFLPADQMAIIVEEQREQG